MGESVPTPIERLDAALLPFAEARTNLAPELIAVLRTAINARRREAAAAPPPHVAETDLHRAREEAHAAQSRATTDVSP